MFAFKINWNAEAYQPFLRIHAIDEKNGA